MHYTFRLTEREDYSWIGVFPDFSEVCFEGCEPQEVREAGKKALYPLLFRKLLTKEFIPYPSCERLGDELVNIPAHLIPDLRKVWLSQQTVLVDQFELLSP